MKENKKCDKGRSAGTRDDCLDKEFKRLSGQVIVPSVCTSGDAVHFETSCNEKQIKERTR